MTASASGEHHVSPNALAAYIEGKLDGSGRAAVVEHLADCAECRRELVDARRVLRPNRTRLVVGVTAGLAIAASLILAVLPNARDPGGSGADRLRAGGVGAGLVAYGPLGEVSAPLPTIVWGAAGPDVAYRVAVTAADGSPVWRASTADTVATLPDSVTLAPNTTYRWWADALMADGTTRTTGVREFRISR